MVDGATQRLPTESGVGTVKIGDKGVRIECRAYADVVVSAGIRASKVNVGRFAKVAVETKMADDADILALVGGENITGVAAINLRGSLEEPVFGGGKKTGKGDARIIDAVFAANEIVRRQRPVDERQRMIVDG